MGLSEQQCDPCVLRCGRTEPPGQWRSEIAGCGNPAAESSGICQRKGRKSVWPRRGAQGTRLRARMCGGRRMGRPLQVATCGEQLTPHGPSREPGIQAAAWLSGFRVRCFAPPRNDRVNVLRDEPDSDGLSYLL